MSYEQTKKSAQEAIKKARNLRELHAKIQMACAAHKLPYKPEAGPPNRVRRANEEALSSILGVIPDAWIEMALGQQNEALEMGLPAQTVQDPFGSVELRLNELREGHRNVHFEFYLDHDDIAHRIPVRAGHPHLGLIYYIAIMILRLDPTIAVETALQELHGASFNEHKETAEEWTARIGGILGRLRRSRMGEEKIPKEMKIKIVLRHLYNAKPKGDDKRKWKALVERLANEKSIGKILEEVAELGKFYKELNAGETCKIDEIKEQQVQPQQEKPKQDIAAILQAQSQMIVAAINSIANNNNGVNNNNQPRGQPNGGGRKGNGRKRSRDDFEIACTQCGKRGDHSTMDCPEKCCLCGEMHSYKVKHQGKRICQREMPICGRAYFKVIKGEKFKQLCNGWHLPELCPKPGNGVEMCQSC